MGLSKKPEIDKKPISRAKLDKILTSARKPTIKAELPSLTQVKLPEAKIKVPTAIEPARAEGTFVPKKFEAGYTPPEVFERTLDNTVNVMANQMGVKAPEKGTYNYNVLRDDIVKQKKSLTTTVDQNGNPVFSQKSSLADSFMSPLNSFSKNSEKGFNYALSSEDDNINVLEDAFRFRNTTSLPKVDNPVLYMAGTMVTPIAQGITGAMTGLAFGGPYGAAGGFLAGALSTFALSAPDGISIRYGTELENTYIRGREEGLDKKEAYKKANSVAKVAAGGETAMQIIYSTFGTPGQIGGKRALAEVPKTKLLNEGAKKGFAAAASKFVGKAKDFVAPGVFLGTEAALATGISEAQAAKEGFSTEQSVEKAISVGSDFAIMDMAIRSVIGAFNIPKYLKSQSKNLLASSDKKIVTEFAREGEASGVYPAGTVNKISSEIASQEKAKQMSPKFPGDDTREAVVVGLTQKLNSLLDEQSKLAQIHKADIQPQIDDISKRIEIAKKAENPLEAELHEDGTPLVVTDKNKINATQKSTEQEAATEGSITERKGVISEQQKEAVIEKTTDAAGDSNRPIISEGKVEDVATPVITFADKIRRFKVDEGLLTGGDKSVAQANIAGLPIAIYNASIEAIALGVEGGAKLAEIIENQIESLKKSGYKFEEDKFRKSVSLIDKVSNERSRIAAESEMSGIKSSDYTMLQRFALEKYNEQSGIYKDIDNLTKALRDELGKKMDTSPIPDSVFEMLAYDSVANESKAPFMPGPAKRITPVGAEPQTIITNPKEVFKSMYTAATNVGKSMQERFLGAANMISEYIKKKDNLDIAPSDITKALSRYITSKMDSETASEIFAENLSDIIENAKDANQILANKKIIKKIRKDAKSPTYGTVATRETTSSIDFISPNKIKDSVDPDNVSEVTILASEKRRKYQELLNDYRNSITGEPTVSRTARLDLIDFIEAERKNFDEFTERKLVEKRSKSGVKYDKLVQEEKIDKNVITREEFIDADTNPTKAVSDEVDEIVSETEVDKVEAYKEVIEGKRADLKNELDNGDIDADDIADVEFLLTAPLDKISTRNLKLFSNIIEDILNGEKPSRVGDIKSDVIAAQSIDNLRLLVPNVRNIMKTEKAGIFRRLFSKSMSASEAYENLGLTNLIRAFNMNSKSDMYFRGILVGGFDKAVNMVNTISKSYTETMYQLFSKDNVVIDGEKINLKGEPILSEMNSQKIGIIAAILNFENPLNTINAIIESTKILSESSNSKFSAAAKERILALKELGIYDLNQLQSTSIDINNAASFLNRRERLVLDFMIKENKNISEQLNQVNRNYFGKSLDISNPNYVGMTTFFTDVLEDFEGVFDGDMFDYNQLNRMQASSTMKRSAEMIFPSSDKNRVVHYDLDVFRTQPKKYHESLTTLMTTEEVRVMSKMFARKEFQNFMKGKYNIEPVIFEKNMSVFKKIFTEYVNGVRKPYIVTREIERQRSAVSKFFYSRMLNSLEAGVLQYIPNIPSLILESPQSFAKAIEVSTSSLFDENKSKALIQFLSQTSQSSRVNAGFEALTKSAKSISDNELLRYSGNAIKNVDSFLGLSLSYGDKLTTVQSLLTGYIKGLIKVGKIKNASEFDIVAEVRNGLDKFALSNAETTMSFINNESSTYAKAKVFRKDYAGYLRMLQSFSHNSATNFLVDLGRFTDDMATNADRLESSKKMLQYLFGATGYGAASYTINDFRLRFTRDRMKSMGIIEDGEDLENAIINDKEKTLMTTATGTLFDALLSRQNAIVGEVVKGTADLGYNMVKNAAADKKESVGEDTRNTILGTEYSPFYESKYMGTAGSFISDMTKLVDGLAKDDTKGGYKNMLSENQKEALRVVRRLELFTLPIPSKDVKKFTSSMKKALKQGAVTQLEKDAQNYIVANAKASDGDYTQNQIDLSKEYMDQQRLLSNDKLGYDSYVQKTVAEFAKNKIGKDELVAKSKQFGDVFSKDVLNIKASSPQKKVVVINNRFPKDLDEDPLVAFMIQNGVISPEDYAMALIFDKKGNPIVGGDRVALRNRVSDRYFKASEQVGLEKYLNKDGKYFFKSPDFLNFETKILAERYMRGKLLE